MAVDQASNPNVAFVEYALKRISSSKGLSANIRRSESPASEYLIWEFLAEFRIPLDYENKRLPYSIVSAAMAHDKASRNGSLSLGRSLALSYPDGNQSTPGKARLRRLLACDDIRELTGVLRQLLSLMRSRVNETLDYALLLSQLKRFPFAPDEVKAQWAQQFYSHVEKPA